MDRGLISSSSSTTRTTPPYRVGSKPLSDELRSKIIALYGGGLFYDDPTEPSKCIDPDDPSSWEHLYDDDDDENPRFRAYTHYFSPNKRHHRPGEEIDGEPVFELYYIVIKKLDPLRDFSSIYIEAANTDYQPMIIYNRPEGEKITLNQPLPLKNIFRPHDALSSVIIALSNPWYWKFWYEPKGHDYPAPVVYGMRQEDVKDKITDSVASISYELIESAAVAELEFTFLDDKERSIKILSGSIFATNDGNPYTKRIIQQFEPSVVLQSKEAISVHRSVFGVPLGSYLNLEVKLNYVVGEDEPCNMEGCLIFPVPKKTKSVEECITSPDGITKMRVKVSWWDFMV